MKDDFTPYKPANGSEGRAFMAQHCHICAADAKYQRTQEAEDGCQILVYAMNLDLSDEEYPRDAWVYLGGEPTCLFFREDDDGDAVPLDPAQLDLFTLAAVTS